MSYITKLQSIETLEQLFLFREELRKVSTQEWSTNNMKMLDDIQEANYFIQRVENRISNLERDGQFLDKIKIIVPKPVVKKTIKK